MCPSNKDASQSNDLHIENELARIKLELERGAKFYKGQESDLPPEIENQWLKNIQQFEELYDNCKQVTVYDFCGKPAFKSIAELQPGGLADALQELYDRLGENEIVLESLCPVEDAELYRFITEELFAYEMDDIRIPGMRSNFIYEEFHPNHAYDIEAACRDFIGQVIQNEFPENNMFMWMAREFYTSDGLVPEAQAFEKMRKVHGKYQKLKLSNFEDDSIVVEDKIATAIFNTCYSGRDAEAEINFSGRAKFMLIYDGDFWSINKFELPGFEI